MTTTDSGRLESEYVARSPRYQRAAATAAAAVFERDAIELELRAEFRRSPHIDGLALAQHLPSLRDAAQSTDPVTRRLARRALERVEAALGELAVAVPA